jgi:glutathione-regulated potassium-efflux system ancillary protein KefG
MTPGAFERQILILFAHPALEKSRVNRVLIEGLADIEGVTFRDLYERYPDFDIDVPAEQARLLEHDLIIFHHPMFWYSTPAILKEWQDLVLEHGWAYGHEGKALRGKEFLSVITTGGRESAYRQGGHNRYTVAELLRPIEQTATLCGMDCLPPFVVHGTHGMTSEELRSHADDYRRTLIALRDGAVDLEAARAAGRLNADLFAVIKSRAR